MVTRCMEIASSGRERAARHVVRVVFFRPGANLVVAAYVKKASPPGLRIVRAGRVDRRGVDGGARADRKPQQLRGGRTFTKRRSDLEVMSLRFCIPDPGRPECGRAYLGRGTYPTGSKPAAIFSGLLKKILST